MSQKSVKKTTKRLSPKPWVPEPDTACWVREDLDERQELPKQATPGEVGGLNNPATAATAEPPLTAAAPAKPLTPLATLWPEPVVPKRGTTVAQAPTAQIRKAPVAAPAPATPSPQTRAQSISPVLPEPQAITQAPKPTPPQSVNVSFALVMPRAKQVSLCGEFNGWSLSATPMQRHQDGHWETTVALAPGQYQYKFIVDGEWMPDPVAQKNVPNQYGSLNSVVEVRA